MTNDKKFLNLKDRLHTYGSLCVGFSGGVDSAFLLSVAKEALGDKVFAVLADTPLMARRDLEDARDFAASLGVSCYLVPIDALSVPELKGNVKRRCYYCKYHIFSEIKKKALTLGAAFVADGKNADDALCYRPGAQAALELGIVSPLYEEGFTKAEIRAYGKAISLPVWDKPSNACLATRIPYDETITLDKLARVEACENLFRERGMEGVRVRYHGDLARIEAPRPWFEKIIAWDELAVGVKEAGFRYVTLDLEGYRSND